MKLTLRISFEIRSFDIAMRKGHELTHPIEALLHKSGKANQDGKIHKLDCTIQKRAMSFRRIGLLTGQSARSGLQAISARQCLGNLREFHLTSKLDRGSKNLDWFVKAVRKLDKMKTAPEIPPFPIETLHGKNRKRAYIDFKFGKDTEESKAPVSRIVVELADDIVPTTVANFLAVSQFSLSHFSFQFPLDFVVIIFHSYLQLSARGEGNGYIASEIFRVQKGFAIFGGDFESNDGRGGHSAFDARYFPDENFIGRHTVPGVLAMASSGVHSNGSVFYFTLAKAPHLGKQHRYSRRTHLMSDANIV